MRHVFDAMVCSIDSISLRNCCDEQQTERQRYGRREQLLSLHKELLLNTTSPPLRDPQVLLRLLKGIETCVIPACSFKYM